MSKSIKKISRSQHKVHGDEHRFEHWLVDNQVYFITARCRGRYPAFASEAAKAVFWDRFEHYTAECSFTPWVTSLMDNHYHTIGYLRDGTLLTRMMQRIHGSVAKLVNDLLPERLADFWRDTRGKKGKEYFDGCIRDERQGRLAYRYILRQGQRHGIVADGCRYPHTRVNVELEVAIRREGAGRVFGGRALSPIYAQRAGWALTA
jgi:REP element-mobilizing transposase RayT